MLGFRVEGSMAFLVPLKLSGVSRVRRDLSGLGFQNFGLMGFGV